MNRRRYLTALALATGVAGCTGLGGSDSPSDPGADTDPGGSNDDDSSDGGGDGGSSDGTGDGSSSTEDGSTDQSGGDGGDGTDDETAGDGQDGGGDGQDGTDEQDETDEQDGSSTGEETAPVPEEFELPIPRDELNRGAPKDGIPAITEPAFGPDWDAIGEDQDSVHEDLSLDDDDEVLGVERDGGARAYPLRILNRHEVVNDTFDGPLLVTFCPLCGSGVTAERTVDGEETIFGVSGLLWNSDLVMYDELTESYWSQILGKAIHGPKTGTQLTLVPSSRTTWSEWKDSHPDTEVLLPPPKSTTVLGDRAANYTYNPYEGYDESEQIGIGFNDFEDDRLHPKTFVIGVTHDGTSRAYPITELGDDTTIVDSVAGLPVVVTTTGSGSLFTYERTVDGETLDFENDGPDHVKAGGSRWEKVTGRAVDGPHEGTQLDRANGRSQMFWFAWLDFHPDTEVYGL